MKKLVLTNMVFGISLMLISGGIMAHSPKGEKNVKGAYRTSWISFHDSHHHLKADFPHQPIAMNFDLPFQNTPPTGSLDVFSCPTRSGVYMLAIFKSSEIPNEFISTTFKKQFEQYLISHLFFNPKIFVQNQQFKSTPITRNGLNGHSFEFSYEDEGHVKHLEGMVFLKDHTQYCLFGLAAKDHFNHHELEHFLDSFKMDQT